MGAGKGGVIVSGGNRRSETEIESGSAASY